MHKVLFLIIVIILSILSKYCPDSYWAYTIGIVSGTLLTRIMMDIKNKN